MEHCRTIPSIAFSPSGSQLTPSTVAGAIVVVTGAIVAVVVGEVIVDTVPGTVVVFAIAEVTASWVLSNGEATAEASCCRDCSCCCLMCTFRPGFV